MVDTALFPAIRAAIKQNELGNASPYCLSYARLGQSGASFGIFQGDTNVNPLARSTLTDVLNAATGMNNSTQKKFRQFVLSRKFDAGFTMGLLAKDLSIAMQVGRETATAAPVSALVNELIVSALSKFGADADHTEMAKLCELLAGSELEAG